MTEGSASKSNGVVPSPGIRQNSWRDDARRSAGARFGAARDFVRDRRWTAIAAAAIVALSGAGVVAAVGGQSTEQAEALEKSVAEREKRVVELDAERKRSEDRLAELQKRLNAKESQIAETEERAAALEKRRADLQRQVAELVAPVAPGAAERVADRQPAEAPASAQVRAASADATDMPPDESADAGPSTASVDAPAAAEPDARGEPIRAASRTDGPGDEPVEAAAPARDAIGLVRVFIHVRAADRAARERAAAVAAELRRRGVEVAQIRGVARPVRRDAVRFFYDQDRGVISELQDAVRSASPRAGSPIVNDFRSFGAPPRRGTIELWLS